MSLLMWNQHPEQIVILADTLATGLGGDPRHYQTKCWTLPHLKLVIAGTGFATILEQWNSYVQYKLLARDITMLNDHAPSALRRLWAEAMDEPDLPAGDHTVTLYHFGADEETGALVRYTYRSTSDFEPEFGPEPGFAVKPPPHDAILPSSPVTVEKMIELAVQVRREQDERPKTERVHIGGELILTMLQEGVISRH